MKTAIATSLIFGAAALGACAMPPHEGGPGVPPPQSEDQCRASQYQNLIGQNRSQIPERPPGATWRVTCTSCPVTMDWRPDRLNILYDQETGVIREVKCG